MDLPWTPRSGIRAGEGAAWDSIVDRAARLRALTIIAERRKQTTNDPLRLFAPRRHLLKRALVCAECSTFAADFGGFFLRNCRSQRLSALEIALSTFAAEKVFFNYCPAVA
jgi:hypothetical protein